MNIHSVDGVDVHKRLAAWDNSRQSPTATCYASVAISELPEGFAVSASGGPVTNIGMDEERPGRAANRPAFWSGHPSLPTPDGGRGRPARSE
jgi:hypothetical protein